MKILQKKYLHFLLSIIMCSPFINLQAQDIKGTFAIKNVGTGIYIRIKDANTENGTPLVAYSPVNWKCVTWNFEKVDTNIYNLKNLFSGKTMQPTNAQAANGTALEEQPITSDKASQQYEFICVEKNVYLIKLEGTDLYITPSDAKGSINAPIILSKKNGSNLQLWSLHEQKPEI